VHLDFESDPENTVTFYGTSEWREEGGNPNGYLSVTDALNGQSGAIEFPDFLDGGSYEGAVHIEADRRPFLNNRRRCMYFREVHATVI